MYKSLKVRHLHMIAIDDRDGLAIADRTDIVLVRFTIATGLFVECTNPPEALEGDSSYAGCFY
jgi:hypothetical protein